MGPPTAESSRSGLPNSGALYCTARNRYLKIAYLSRRYGFRSRTDFQIRDVSNFASSRRADLAVAKTQRVLDLLPNWLDKWRVAINLTKMAALLTGQQRTTPSKLRLRGQDVEWKTKVRYLGAD
ncbi:hypothetical protein EVAR_68276_1 [Eumeta japonica]|uniref:RNA-directed DNA polymerase from mobile element jockey n=1 Tax=Eumeta variegata TaxID=151549 RepID=A0A4C1ZVY8_EUMVA|nr:hypothetical protein EVAR_68276_1 [Eumeta japonica]